MSPRPLQYGLIKPRVLDCLQKADGQHVSTQVLINHVWTMHELDGPDNPENAIARALRELRRHGYPISSKRGRHSPGHWLERS